MTIALRPVPNRLLLRGTARASPRRQRGVVLMFTMIALLILLIVAVALARSFQSSMFNSGNIAFKRDLQNQSERAVALVLPIFAGGGGLGTPAARGVTDQSKNYSAVILPTNAQGIPTALLASDFGTTWTAGDITPPASDPSFPARQIESIRYIVDRLCSTAGNESTLGSTQCTLRDDPTPSGTSASNLQGAERIGVSSTNAAAALQTVVYRISIRITGPRNTQSFFQSTFSVPS